ncbi:hypothetical protein [Yersinia ruckeri]|uniref:hypothetical protein n=1 Tax=Yersinia ruckeri TaxID=29486 RepID=UPI002238F2D6|nr:hypothetical protein [Yersinia ruckeri]MCW6598632.1 hypothetical protein [Yersinia ruckeri]
MTSSRFDIYRHFADKPEYSKTQLALAVMLSELATRKDVQSIYLKLMKVPYTVQKDLSEACTFCGFIINWDNIFASVLQNITEFAHYSELPIGNPNRFKAKILSVLKSKQSSYLLDRVEKILGVTWTRDMLPSENTGSDGKIQIDKVFMPLSLMLVPSAKKLLENVRKQLRVEPPREQLPAVEQPVKAEAPKKESAVEKQDASGAPKEILIKKYSEVSVSLMNHDKKLFKDMFFDLVHDN